MAEQHFAVVPHGSPVVLPDTDEGHFTPEACSKKAIRQQIHSIYESYANMYPNPMLSQERQERDRLQRAVSAASHASKMNHATINNKKSRGLWSFLWGSKGDKENINDDDEAAESLADNEDDEAIQYIEEDVHSDALCGTDSLDTTCIPPEAHAMARFHLASMRTRGERPNAVRPSWEVAGSSVLIITGLGELVEFTRKGGGEPGRRLYTSDREHLQEYAAAISSSTTENGFHVAYARGATIGPNLLAVSWGLGDGLVVFYRRLVGQQLVAWEPVACLSASEAVKANVGDVFLEEQGSALLRVADICPLVFEVLDAPPWACLAVGRLGGYIEIVTLPTRMWYGPEIDPPASKRQVRRRKGAAIDHYAIHLRDLALDAASIVALTTAAYALDCICLEAFQTNVSSQSTWDSDTYPDAPPAEFVLAATGISTKGAGEIACFWAVSSKAPTTDDGHARQDGCRISASLTETILLGPAGAEFTVFASPSIMNLWRRPRQVVLGGERQGVSCWSAPSINRVTTISVPAPVLSMRFDVKSNGDVLGCFLDANGGIAIVDCHLLNRLVSHSLSPQQYELLFQNEEDDDVPLATISADRTAMHDRIASHQFEDCINDIQFLGESLASNKSLLATMVPTIGLVVFSLADFTCAVLSSPTITSSLLRYNFAGLLLASASVDDQGICSVSSTAVRSLDPRNMVRSLVDMAIYGEAVKSAERLSEDQQKDVSEAMDLAYKHLWEETWSVETLKKVDDSLYVVEQALSMGALTSKVDCDADCFALFRDVHRYALTIVLEGKGPTQLAFAAVNWDAEAVSRQLINRLVKLGTYALLCDHFGMANDFTSFCSEFLSLKSFDDLAKSLARNANIDALTILWYRHTDDLKAGHEMLNEISPSISPLLYSHLLPVSLQQPHFLAIDRKGEAMLRAWSDLPAYLSRMYDLALVLDDEDESIISLHHSSTVVKEFADDILYAWYESRVLHFQAFGASVRNTLDLCRLGLQALSITNGYDDTLSRVFHFMAGLDRPHLALQAKEGPLSRFIGLPFHLLQSKGLDDLVAMLFEGVSEMSEACDRYLEHLMPLCISTDRLLIDKSLVAYCTHDFGTLLNDLSESTIGNFFSAIDRCVICANASKVSLDIELRMIRESTLLLDLVETAFVESMQLASALTLNNFQRRKLIDQLWSLYECTPARLTIEGIDDPEDKHNMADEMYEALVVLSILSEWPGCQAFNIIQGADGHFLHERVLSCLCRSFFGVLKEHYNALNEEHATTLLVALLSDIRELERARFDPSFSSRDILTSELLLPLIRRSKVALLRQSLAISNESWINWGSITDEIIAVVNELVYADGDIQQALEYQSILIQHCPEAYDKVVGLQRSLDAANYINTVLLFGRNETLLHPRDIRDENPIDIIDQVLKMNPSALVCRCEVWANSDQAASMNERMRNHDADNEPHIGVGQAVLHLASLLGLESSTIVAYIKHCLVASGVAARLYGASAAMCRSLVRSSIKPTESEILLIISAVRYVVLQSDYSDVLTKEELCQAALLAVSCGTSYPSTRFVEGWLPILGASADCEIALRLAVDSSVKPKHVTSRLCYDTFSEYGVILSDLFLALRCQALSNSVDDSLLETISRYTIYWCIAQFTRGKCYLPPSIESAFAHFFVNLFISFSMHVSERRGLESFQAVHDIVREQLNATRLQRMGSSPLPTPDLAIVNGLLHRGYSRNGARRAALATDNVGLEDALQWAVIHSLDDDFEAPIFHLKDHSSSCFDSDSGFLLMNVLDMHYNELPDVTLFSPMTSVVSNETELNGKRIGQLETDWENDNKLCNLNRGDLANDVSEVASHQHRVPAIDSEKVNPFLVADALVLVNGSNDVIEHSASIEEAFQLEDLSEKVNPSLVADALVNGSNNVTEHSASIEEAFQLEDLSEKVNPSLVADALVNGSNDVTEHSARIEEAIQLDLLTVPIEEEMQEKSFLVTSLRASEIGLNTGADCYSVTEEPVHRKELVSVNLRAEPITNNDATHDAVSSSSMTPQSMLANNHRNDCGLSTPISSSDDAARDNLNGFAHAATPSDCSSVARAHLLESGQRALQFARSSASPSSEERRRLIEEGRRLLQLSRRTPATASSQHRYPLRSMAATSTASVSTAEQASAPPASPLASTSGNGTATQTAKTAVNIAISNEKSDWDFEDDDLGDLDNDGWGFDEDLS